MVSLEIPLNNDYIELKTVFDNIYSKIITTEGRINENQYQFNNYIGDITKDIRWTWAINQKSKDLFNIKSIMKQINDFFHNDFIIQGCSFITLYDKQVSKSCFHMDVTSHYDSKDSTNALTLIFPLYIDNDMGGLEYKDKGKKKIYKYDCKKAIIWDACKFEHRTQPYTLTEKKKRVLVSINLSTEEEWAKYTVIDSLKYQGNI